MAISFSMGLIHNEAYIKKILKNTALFFVKIDGEHDLG